MWGVWGTVTCVVLSTVFTVAGLLVGVFPPEKIQKHRKWIAWCAAALGVLFATLSIAGVWQQHLEEEKLETQLGKLIPPWIGVESFRELTNDQLRTKVAALCKGLREFETSADAAVEKLVAERRPFPQGSTQEQKEAMWRAFTASLEGLYMQTQSDYRKLMWPEARATEEELRRRISTSEAPPDIAQIALENGGIGNGSLSAACLYLEKLARQLPP